MPIRIRRRAVATIQPAVDAADHGDMCRPDQPSHGKVCQRVRRPRVSVADARLLPAAGAWIAVATWSVTSRRPPSGTPSYRPTTPDPVPQRTLTGTTRGSRTR